MKAIYQNTRREKYENPTVELIPLSMESVICGSNGTTQKVGVSSAYDGEDLDD